MTAGVVIAGGGLAAQRCCETLRGQGYEGPIRMVCAEPVAPYDRPPLSKELLAGTLEAPALALRPDGWHADNAVELLLGRRARRLDPSARQLELDDGTRLPYQRLLIATGSEPRRIPAAVPFENVHVLRTLADATALRAALAPGARLAVIGAGFIGQEVAATARGLGAVPTIVEALPAPLVGILGAQLGTWFAELHRSEGVDVHLGAGVAGFDGAGGRVERIELADGRRIGCDAVLLGIGVSPATRWLDGSGLDPTGVTTDPVGRSALPDVYAAGDAARQLDPRLGSHVRSEHWESAARQGAAAARAMLGLAPRPATIASFWSDQYGIRIQYVGHAAPGDTVTLDGDPGARDFTAIYARAGRPVAALLVGRPRALPRIRRLIETGATDSEWSQAA